MFTVNFNNFERNFEILDFFEEEGKGGGEFWRQNKCQI